MPQLIIYFRQNYQGLIPSRLSSRKRGCDSKRVGGESSDRKGRQVDTVLHFYGRGIEILYSRCCPAGRCRCPSPGRIPPWTTTTWAVQVQSGFAVSGCRPLVLPGMHPKYKGADIREVMQAKVVVAWHQVSRNHQSPTNTIINTFATSTLRYGTVVPAAQQVCGNWVSARRFLVSAPLYQ